MAALTSDSIRLISVTKRVSIKSFVQGHKLDFKKGCGYYQLTKPEVIQEYKKVVARRKSDGSYVTGDTVRKVLGIEVSKSKKFSLDVTKLPDFDVFVQSTSVNRILLPGTNFLYGNEKASASPPPETPPPETPRGRNRKAAGTDEASLTPTKGRKRKAAGTDEASPTPAKGRKRKAAGIDEASPTPTKGRKRKAAGIDEASPTPTKGRKRKAAGTDEASPTPARGQKRKATGTDEASPTKKARKEADDEVDGASAVASKAGPSGFMEVVISFDTTGSMYPCLTQVRRKVAETVKRLQKEIVGIRIAIIAHGDYCDEHGSYVTKIMDFTTDSKRLCTFVEKVEATGGGDWPECYELVLYEARTKLSWTPGTQRSLVMIGDAIPHEPSYPMNRLKLDWKKEASKLYNEMAVKIYSVQALNNNASNSFYQQLASLTSGYHLHLDQFSSIVQFIMAICFREQSMDKLQAYEDETKKGPNINRSLHKLFDVLSDRTASTDPFSGGTSSHGLTPVKCARFQVLDVDDKCDIRSFVNKNGLIFKTGRGFYEFTKPEKISDQKEVVLVDKMTGDMFTGPEACRVIGAGGSSRIKPTSLDQWRVFVQSTSYNRVLIPGTGFLFEVDPDH